MPREGKPATCDEGFSGSDNDNTKPGTTISAKKKEEKKNLKKRLSNHEERSSTSDDSVVKVAQSDDLFAIAKRLLVIPVSKKDSRKPKISAAGGSHSSPIKPSAGPVTTERNVSFKENPRHDKNAKEYFGRKDEEDVIYTTSSTSRSARPPLAIPRNMHPMGRLASYDPDMIPVPPPPQAPSTLADRFSRTGQPNLNDTPPITFAPRQRAADYYEEDQGDEDEFDLEEQRREAREARRAHEQEKLEKKRIQKLLREGEREEREAQLDDEEERLDRRELLTILEREHIQREREQQKRIEDARRMPPPGLPQRRGSHRHSRDGGIPQAPESPSIEEIREKLDRLNRRSRDEKNILHAEKSERPHILQRGTEPAIAIRRPSMLRTSQSSSASCNPDPSYPPGRLDAEVPGVRRDRRHSVYTGASSSGPSATSSNYEEAERLAMEYQNLRAAEFQPKLTADWLNKQQKAIAGSQSTRSTTSRDDSEYEQSATTKTTNSGSCDGLETILNDGTAKLTTTGAENGVASLYDEGGTELCRSPFDRTAKIGCAAENLTRAKLFRALRPNDVERLSHDLRLNFDAVVPSRQRAISSGGETHVSVDGKACMRLHNNGERTLYVNIFDVNVAGQIVLVNVDDPGGIEIEGQSTYVYGQNRGGDSEAQTFSWPCGVPVCEAIGESLVFIVTENVINLRHVESSGLIGRGNTPGSTLEDLTSQIRWGGARNYGAPRRKVARFDVIEIPATLHPRTCAGETLPDPQEFEEWPKTHRFLKESHNIDSIDSATNKNDEDFDKVNSINVKNKGKDNCKYYDKDNDDSDNSNASNNNNNNNVVASSSGSECEDEKELDDKLSKRKDTDDFITCGHHTDMLNCSLRKFLRSSLQQDLIPTVADDDPTPLADVSADLNCDNRAALQLPATLGVNANAVNQSLIQELSFNIMKKIWNQLKRTWRPPLRSRHRRLEWICGCGDVLYADLLDDGDGTLTKLAALLPYSTTITPSSRQSSRLESLVIPKPLHHRSSSSLTSNIPNGTPPRPLSHEIHNLIPSTTTASPSKPPQFLELCVNTGQYLKVLGEIPTANIDNDGDLFKSIKEKYLELRGYRAKFWLLMPSAVNYVHISVENGHRLGILDKPCVLPPKVEVDAKRYVYDPCPLVGGVPIPDHLFLHYMNCPNPSSKDAWLRRLPKKLNSSMTYMAPALSYGWGVHIDEGPNYAAIAWTNLGALLLSGVAAVLWSFLKHDFQGAFGFACWIVAVLNTVTCCYFFRWKHE